MCHVTHSVTWLILMCDVTHSVTWLILMCAFWCMTWLIPTYMWRDPILYVARLISMCNMTLYYVWHTSFICVTWLIHMCDMTHSYVWHDSSICVTRLVYRPPFQRARTATMCPMARHAWCSWISSSGCFYLNWRWNLCELCANLHANVCMQTFACKRSRSSRNPADFSNSFHYARQKMLADAQRA